MSKSKMTKARIAAGVALKTKLNGGESQAAVNAVFEILATALEQGEPVEIRGFGAFQVVERRGRKGRNPRTGEVVIVGPKKAVRFRASKEIRL